MFFNFLCFVLLATGILPIRGSTPVSVTSNETDVFSCDVLIAHVLRFDRALQNTTVQSTDEVVSCLVDDLVYSIPVKIVETHKKQLKAPGQKTMNVKGGSLPGRGNRGGSRASSDEIVVSSASDITFGKSGGRRKLSGSGSQRKAGTSEVLVIRVIANDARTSLSANLLYNRIFGNGLNVVQDREPNVPSGTLAKTYTDCSHGKLKIVPAKGYDIVKGVGFVKINMNVKGASNRQVENAVTTAINSKYGSVWNWDHIIYCLPRGTAGSWAAYGYNSFYRTVYNDDWCGQNSVVVHEIGHNIGLYHSNKEGNYRDETCMMGPSYKWTGGPRMCFNAHKHWVLGWFRDRQVEILPNVKPWKGRLLAFTDYQRAINGDYVLIHFSDVYIQYNRAQGANIQVQENRNQIVIIKASGEDFESELLVGLALGTSTLYKNYKIEFCSRVPYSTDRQFAVVQVSRKSDNVSCLGRT